MVLALTACVTINIYFPAAAAEAARAPSCAMCSNEPQEQAHLQPGRTTNSRIHRRGAHWPLRSGVMMEALVAPAQATQADININTAAISAIRASMQKRQSRLAPFYRSGVIGFDNKGLGHDT